MSLCIYARVQKKCITQELLDKNIHDYFSTKHNILQKESKKEISYDIVNDYSNIIISFIAEKKPPYNVYDSDIIGDEFEFLQLIIFDIDKETSFTDEYKKVIKFCEYLKNQIESNILVTSDMHDEICFLKQNTLTWSEGKEIIFCKPTSN